MPNLSIKISKSALIGNIKSFKKTLGRNVLLAPAVKANAYGHDLILSSRLMLEAGADWLCVTSVEEAKNLRQAKIKSPILIIGPTSVDDAASIVQYDYRVFLYSLETARSIDRQAKLKNKTVKVHIKLDTGMSRQGLPYRDVIDFTKKILLLKNLNIEGVATHFATADEKLNNSHFTRQFKNFQAASGQLEKFLGKKLIRHCANSAAAMLYPQARMDMCRIGISAYGCYPSPEVKNLWEKSNQPLHPVMSVVTRISQIKTVPAGACVSYGCTYKTTKPTKLATIPVGYFEGLPRSLSNCGAVAIKNKIAPIVGRVCMDITVLDVSNIPDLKIGDEVEIIGRHMTADSLAAKAKTINYEILTNWKESTERIAVK